MHYGKNALNRAWDALFFPIFFARGLVVGILFLLALGALIPSSALAQVRYYYDELGRLIEVVAPDGNSAQYTYDPAGNITSIKKLGATAISLAEFTPNAGPVGTVVTLYGSGFSATASSNTVKFNGTTAAVSAATATSLTVTVPAGATTGVITVANANGTATSASSFVVGVPTPAPTITSFTPQIGTMGTVVTVTGTNFQTAPEDNKAAFGTLTATVIKDASSPTPTQLKLSVPTPAASGKISVTTPSGKATSAADFYALPSTINPADVEFKGRLVVNGPTLQLTTTAPGKKAVLLFDGQIQQTLHLLSAAGTFTDTLWFRVYAPDGRVIEDTYADNAGIRHFSKLSGAAATGTYTIIFSPGATDKGSMALSLVDDVVGTLNMDGSTAIDLKTGRDGQFSFSAEAGKGYGLAITGLVFTPNAYNYLQAKLHAPDGTYLTNCGMSSAGSCDFPPQFFTNAGNYKIVFNSIGVNAVKFNAVFSKDAGGPIVVDAASSSLVIAREGQNGRYTFSGVAGQPISVLMSNNTLDDGNPGTSNSTYVYLYKPSDALSPIAFTYFNTGTTSGPLDVVLPETGAYNLYFYPSDLDKGSLGVQLKSYAVGALTVDGSTAISLSSGRNGRYSFTAEAGKGYGLAVTGLSFTPTAGGSLTAMLRKADGTLITHCGFNASDSCNFEPSHFPTSGSYLIDFDPAGTNAATFTAVLSKDTSGVLAVDAANATTMSIAREGQNGRYTFSGTAGQRVSVVFSGNTLDDNNSATNNYTYIFLYKPSDAGNSVAWTYLYAGAPSGTLDAVLTESGTYTLFIDPSALDKGSVSVQVKSYLTGSLVMNGSTAVNLSAGRNGRYSFTAEAGKGYGLAINGLSFTPAGGYLTANLLKADGTFLASCSISANDSCDFEPRYFSTAGSYLIEFDPMGTNAAAFNAILSKDTGGALTVGAAATTVTIAREGQNGRYTFSGTAGQSVRVQLTGNALDDGNPATSNYTYLWLFKPSDVDATAQIGTTLLATTTASSSFDVVLPEAGIYTLFLNPTVLDKGTIGLRVINQ